MLQRGLDIQILISHPTCMPCFGKKKLTNLALLFLNNACVNHLRIVSWIFEELRLLNLCDKFPYKRMQCYKLSNVKNSNEQFYLYTWQRKDNLGFDTDLSQTAVYQNRNTQNFPVDYV